MRRTILAFSLALSLTGCASAPATNQEQQALSDLLRFAKAARTALVSLKAAVDIEVSLHDAKVISNADHAKYLDYVEILNDGIDDALKAAQDVTSPAVTRREVVRYLLHRARDSLSERPLPISDDVLRVRLTAALQTALIVLEVVS